MYAPGSSESILRVATLRDAPFGRSLYQEGASSS
jgi:hypothetical protein